MNNFSYFSIDKLRDKVYFLVTKWLQSQKMQNGFRTECYNK
jgi:hypothetical protein